MSAPRRAPVGLLGRWGVNPYPPAFRFYERYKVTAGRIHRLVVVSPRPLGVITHYVDGRDQVCTHSDTQDCWVSHKETSSRFHAWIAVVEPPHRVIRLVALTNNSMWCDPRLQDEAFSLTGRTMELRRVRNYDWAEMSVRLVDDAPVVTDIPLEPNLVVAVKRLFEAPDRSTPGGAASYRAFRLSGGGATPQAQFSDRR